MLKISVVTASYNRQDVIMRAIVSFSDQIYADKEHVFIDGASTDDTVKIIKSKLTINDIFISEPDDGIYDALNKGLDQATGDVIGFLHSDDCFADNNVLSDIAIAFEDKSVDLVYGDLQYINPLNAKTVRDWKSGEFSLDKLKKGWMPPHPTVFIRASLLEKLGNYNTDYRISADYDYLLRYLKQDLNVRYIPRCLVYMNVGGISNSSLGNIVLKSIEDWKSIRNNNIGGLSTLVFKNLSKLSQFIKK